MATYTNLNLDLIADGALESFVKTLLPLNAFSTSFRPETMGRARGNDIIVPLVGTLTATTFANAYNICGGTKTAVTVTINRHKIVHTGQHDLDAINNSDSGLRSFGMQQGRALAQAVIEDIFTLFTTANFGLATAVASTAVAAAQLRAGRLMLAQANALGSIRSLVLDCVPYDDLLAITHFTSKDFVDGSSGIVEARIGRLYGMNIFEVNSPFGSVNSVMGVFAVPSSVAVGMRYLPPQRPEEYIVAQAFADPETGAVFGLRNHYDPNTGSEYLNLECNYGFSVGISNGARVLKRTD